ncbi:MAG: pyruvate dehydrogenase (acetyl-transferring) E1 component subunit alpha [Pseudobdellovibrionaceae bacterium]
MNQELLLRLFKNMLRLRHMEELCAELYTKEKIRGFLHLYIGEEAVACGVLELLTPEDNVVATYREHGHALLKGIPARAIMAEMFGKKDGCSKGRGGSMHLYSREQRFFGGNAIVASGLPHAVGLALAAKMLGEKRTTICFFGDGAMAEGEFHESINLAALWRLPILFCCENNLYAMGTALSRSQSQTDLAKKASSYNLPAESVDGMSVTDVVEKTGEALRCVRSERVPYFLEFKTYRFRPHSMFDPDLYRSKEEIEQWKKRCPIENLKKDLLAKNILDENKLRQLHQEVEREFIDAVEFAESSEWEPVQDLEKDVYYANDLSRGPAPGPA